MAEIRELARAELPIAVQLLSNAMRDDPMHQVVFGPDPEHRVVRLSRFFDAQLAEMAETPLAAWEDGRLVGFLTMAPPGTCWPPLLARLRMACRLLTPNLAEMWRLHRWASAWEARDLHERHWHLGPVAVATDRQRCGIGSQLLQRFCERMDQLGEVAFLETDRPDNLRFYGRQGFELTNQLDVMGVRGWWMRRSPRGTAKP